MARTVVADRAEDARAAQLGTFRLRPSFAGPIAKSLVRGQIGNRFASSPSTNAYACLGATRAQDMNEIRKFEPGGKDPLLVLAAEVRELRREQRILLEQAERASERLKLVSRAALAGCILLSLELIVDIVTTVLRATP